MLKSMVEVEKSTDFSFLKNQLFYYISKLSS